MKDQLEQAIIDGNEDVATAMTQALVADAGMAVERTKELVE